MTPTLYQLNSGAPGWLVNKASWQLDRWLIFLYRSKEVLKQQNQEILFDRVWVRLQDEDGEPKEEIRYYWNAKGLREREAKKLDARLFGEGNHGIFDQKESFRAEDKIKIRDRNPEEGYLLLSKPLLPKDELAEEVPGTENKKREIRSRKKADKEGVFGTVLEGRCIAWLRPDTYQLDKQIEALQALKFRPLSSQMPLLRLFGDSNDIAWHQYIEKKQVLDWKILTDESFDGYEEQRTFVEKALVSPDFALLEGPPGSGKTTTIIELILQLVQKGKRVLLCSATHVAIDNVIWRMIDPERYGKICEELVVPVRIGMEEQSVREEVRPYLLQKLVRTKKEAIRERLLKDHSRQSESYLLKHLNTKDEQDFIAQLILESANLVGGTMIGILQHPSIKAAKLLQSFDVLIVDEASKVTFQEFLVPALHAKKWVLVGDIQQLSPYVEDDYVTGNLQQLVQDASKRQFLADVFHARRARMRGDKYLQVIFSEKVDEKVLQEMDAEGLVVEMKKGDGIDEQAKLRMNGADFLIVPASPGSAKLTLNHLDVRAHFHQLDLPWCLGYNRQVYLHRGKRDHFPFESVHRDEPWEEMLGRQLETQYGYRTDPVRFQRAREETKLLVPTSISKDVEIIERVAFPSILELLQRGVGRATGQRDGTVFTDGLPVWAQERRFQSLTYQHRMHEDIAKCSRIHFYEDNRLLTSQKVHDRAPLGYMEAEGAIVWVHNADASGHGDRIINPTEVEDIRAELEGIWEFAKINARFTTEKPLEVGVLTFYKNQESELRKMLRKFTGQGQHNRNFSKGNMKITLCTVDKFQGDEADIILLSFVKRGKGAFYHSPNRLNVALTRARYKLVLFGNRRWMEEKSPMAALNYLGREIKSRVKSKTKIHAGTKKN